MNQDSTERHVQANIGSDDAQVGTWVATTPHLDLRPAQPPGRRSRKARTYGDQIRRLHAEGYSLELIRQALADVGVVVGKSTVQREASRRAPPIRSAEPAPTGSRPPEPEGTTEGTRFLTHPSSPAVFSERQRGKDIAEAFMNNRIANSLLRKGQR